MRMLGNDMIIRKGDTEEFTLWQERGGVHVPFVDGDTVYFTVKTSTKTTTKILQKIIANFIDGKAIVRLEYAETSLLEVRDYVYDAQVTNANDTKKTIAGPSKFIVKPEVTYD